MYILYSPFISGTRTKKVDWIARIFITSDRFTGRYRYINDLEPINKIFVLVSSDICRSIKHRCFGNLLSAHMKWLIGGVN